MPASAARFSTRNAWVKLARTQATALAVRWLWSPLVTIARSLPPASLRNTR